MSIDRIATITAVAIALVAISVLVIPRRSKGTVKISEPVFSAYEDGKHRRYELMFAVNGGAFALVEFIGKASATANPRHLTSDEIAVGMVGFTLIMFFDIFAFGMKMRQAAAEDDQKVWQGTFSLVGQLVLSTICILLCAAWYLDQGLLDPGYFVAIPVVIGIFPLVACFRG